MVNFCYIYSAELLCKTKTSPKLILLKLILSFFFSSIEYWFRCMDLDGDGVLSMYELEYFYSEQVSKMEVLGIETMVFEDCLCQVWSIMMRFFI